MQTIETLYGELIPQYTTDDLRKKELLPCIFHGNGVPKSVPLESQTMIATPAGEIPAELITFHSNGTVSRIFPLNGKLSGYWSEGDEINLARPVTLVTPVGPVTARFISVGFYEDGTLRSLTFCPGDTVSVPTPVGYIEARIGVSFSPDGQVSSLEPAKPTPVETPVGEIMAYDPDAVGVNGDHNSLGFADDGSVTRIATTLTWVKAVTPDGRTTMIKPEVRQSYCSDSELEIIPLQLSFEPEVVTLCTLPDAPPVSISKGQTAFFTGPHLPQMGIMSKPACSAI